TRNATAPARRVMSPPGTATAPGPAHPGPASPGSPRTRTVAATIPHTVPAAVNTSATSAASVLAATSIARRGTAANVVRSWVPADACAPGSPPTSTTPAWTNRTTSVTTPAGVGDAPPATAEDAARAATVPPATTVAATDRPTAGRVRSLLS